MAPPGSERVAEEGQKERGGRRRRGCAIVLRNPTIACRPVLDRVGRGTKQEGEGCRLQTGEKVMRGGEESSVQVELCMVKRRSYRHDSSHADSVVLPDPGILPLKRFAPRSSGEDKTAEGLKRRHRLPLNMLANTKLPTTAAPPTSPRPM